MNIFDLIVVQPIFNLLIFLYSIIPGADFGVSLIVVTVLIRFLLWPLVKKQLHQTKAMRKLQPELQKIRKRSKGNRQAQSMQMMELYKEHGVSPFGQIGILLIQLPIFIALYQVIRIFTLHRDRIEEFTYGFLQNIPAIKEIIKNPDSFNERLFGFVDLTGSAISAEGINVVIVILAVVAAFSQYFLSKQTMPQQESEKRLRDILAEAGNGAQPDQAEMNAVMQRKMMKFLPFMMFFIMVSLPAALALYYAVSNIIAFGQNHYILKQDEVELDKLAKASVTPKNTKPKTTTKNKNKSATTRGGAKSKPPVRAKISSGTKVTRITAKDNLKRK